MNYIEKDLIDRISEADQDREESKKKISSLQEELVRAESDLIEATVRRSKLQEQLRLFRASDPTYIPDARDLEIKSFREKLDIVMKKIEEEKPLS